MLASRRTRNSLVVCRPLLPLVFNQVGELTAEQQGQIDKPAESRVLDQAAVVASIGAQRNSGLLAYLTLGQPGLQPMSRDLALWLRPSGPTSMRLR